MGAAAKPFASYVVHENTVDNDRLGCVQVIRLPDETNSTTNGCPIPFLAPAGPCRARTSHDVPPLLRVWRLTLTKLIGWPCYMNISIRVMLWTIEQPSSPVDFEAHHACTTLNETEHVTGSAGQRTTSYLVHENTVLIDVFKIFASRIKKLARPTAVAHVSRPSRTVSSSGKP